MILALQFSFLGMAPCAFPQALEQTTALLNNPAERDKVIQGDPKAQKADQQVKDLGLSPAGESKVYELSGSILEKLNAETGGDPDKMSQKVQELSRDPASLEKMLSEEQKAQIHEISVNTHTK